MNDMCHNNITNRFKEILSQKGPHVDDYHEIIRMVNDLSSDDEIEQLREMLEPVLKPDTIIGHSFTKPLGYNGDYLIIEKMYKFHKNTNPEYIKWDEFFHWLPAATAVINRKKLAVDLLQKLNRQTHKENFRVLILGSGPATEVNEYLSSVSENKLLFDLVDFDQRAIEHASAKNQKYLEHLTFHNKNVLRYSPEGSYDLIWSAGLFDYFQDRLFTRLLKRFSCCLNGNGEMIIGNFDISNPSKRIMEVMGDWFLYHRSQEHLMSFAMEAGIPPENIEIFSEPLGINLFMKIKNLERP